MNNSWRLYTILTKELLKLLPGQETTHIGQELHMMYWNYVENVKSVLKIMLIHHCQTWTMLMPMDQHSSMVLILVKLKDIPTLLLWIITHSLYLNVHCPHWLALQWLLLSKPIFSDTGIPLTLVTDNALCFTSEEFENFAKSWNFTHITSSQDIPKATPMQRRLWVWLSRFTIIVMIHCMEC